MRSRPNPVEALVTLPRLRDPAERLANWRQAITALGQSMHVTGPPPLDGARPDRIVRSLQVALNDGLCDDLDFISPAAAAVALYELTAALAPGRERRELGRRMLARLYQGTAATFAAVATRMALGAGKPLEAATLRARVALIFDMPISSSVNADSLALSLVTRRELFERWIVQPALRSLHSRRLAAQLIEHAAREACMRAQQGDGYFCDWLTSPSVLPSFERLLYDRESLVWRHAAVARGLLAGLSSTLKEQIELELDPSGPPEHWRRAAVSLVAEMVWEPTAALAACQRLLDGSLPERDPELGQSLVWGLPRVIEAEPDAAEELIEELCRSTDPKLPIGLAHLLQDVQSLSFGQRAVPAIAAALDSVAGSAPSELCASAVYARRALDRADDSTLRAKVRRALGAFESSGATQAAELSREALEAVRKGLERFTASDGDGPSEGEAAALLGDLDGALLERSRLADLLLLGRAPGDSDPALPEVYELHEQLGRVLLERTRAAGDPGVASAWLGQEPRLQSLLHVVDASTAQVDSDNVALRNRLKDSIRLLLELVAAAPADNCACLCGALARALDAVARESVAEPSDLLLAVAQRVDDPKRFGAIAEACRQPDVQSAFQAYAGYLQSEAESRAERASDELAGRASSEEATAFAERIVQLSRGLGAGGSYRGEALRKVVLRLGRALETIAGARGLSELIDARSRVGDPVSELEQATDALCTLSQGALVRVLDEAPDDAISVVADVAPLSALLERAISAAMPLEAEQLAMSIRELVADLPSALAEPMLASLARLDTLPVAVSSDVFAIPLERRRASLPDWLLPRRTIGAFYVVRALGTGGVSSVFVARRVEERHDPDAEAFALKVPQFDPTSARSLSEQEFLQMFREEAGALLSLPAHANLARFVTFDLAARPKPILVMELIRGASLDRLIRSRSATIDTVFDHLDGILSGLGAMHAAGVGHLDVKPSNVILRDGRTPVLVDFGLSGRHLRPGCGTLEYCAPEILGDTPPGVSLIPMPSDVYAFACLAFELLTTELLFDADDEMGLIGLQLEHDGWPEKLKRLADDPAAADLAVLLSSCLRKDPRKRPSTEDVRQSLADVRASALGAQWPFQASEPAPLELRA